MEIDGTNPQGDDVNVPIVNKLASLDEFNSDHPH